MSAAAPLLRVSDLTTRVDAGGASARVVDGASFSVARGETFALLGESGCGKSMTALSVMRLLPEVARIAGGSVLLEGRELLALTESQMRAVRGGDIGMIFQEPMTSLNPVLTVGEQIAEAVARHAGLAGRGARDRAVELLAAVNIPEPGRRFAEYPFQLSGGMKQRAMIAMAVAGEPRLLIADEPTTALDVTIQAQVLELLRGLQRRKHMSILLITHDLGVVAEMADSVAVMYAGEIVEQAPVAEFFAAPLHPYSQKLFAALPAKARRGGALEVIRGSVPPLTRRFAGCRFADRCDAAWDLCRSTAPGWIEAGARRGVRCHLHAEGRGGRIKDEGAGTEERIASVREPGAGSRDSGGRTQDSGFGFQRGAAGTPAAARDAGPASEPSVSLNPESPIHDPVLRLSDLKVHFPIRKGLLQRVVGQVRAVDGVSLAIPRGRTLALVGESGCGKTTVGKGILQLVRPTAGSVRLDGAELTRLRGAALRECRRHFQIIFQDPYSSLNPRMRVAEILEEGMTALGVETDPVRRAARAEELMQQVGLRPEMRLRYPHEFSGGQRQRIAIARALAVNPRLIVCDEPTSALDVSVQAQILNLLKGLQDSLGIAYLFITHNIAVVEYLAHEVAVMYLGRIVERGTVEEVLEAPRHPYTRALLASVPRPEPGGRREVLRLAGELPSPANPPVGCHFHPRCPQASEVCRQVYPAASAFSDTHSAHCHLYRES